MNPHPRRQARFVSAGVLLALSVLLAGCSAGSTSDSGAAPAAAEQVTAGDLARPGAPGDAQGGSAAGGGGADPAAGYAASGASASKEDAGKEDAGRQASSALGADALTTKRVRTADITVQVKDIGGAAARVRAAADRFGGSVSSEKTQSAVPEQTFAQSVLVLRVPEADFDETIAAVAAVGTELTRSASDEDVTAVLADLESREATQRASVDRVRVLMAKATTIQDIVLLESELSRREADLEAAQASRRVLADQAAQSTLTVTLTTGDAAPEPENEGFVAGLKDSWHAVQRSTTVLLTVIGALLPVAVALAVLGWPAYLLTRRVLGARKARTAPVSQP
jgi:hypothetical protein